MVAGISYLKEVKSNPQANEFRITGAGSESADAALHDSMLQNEEAEAMSDIAAFDAAISIGIPVELAASSLLGDLARSRLIAAGIISE